jgi:DNA-binding CsgD family transcriptional regulator
VQALESVYGLTAAEAAVVRGLVEGRSLEEIAAERRVKPDTARTQLKQVFAKTRTRRQAELVRLVLTGIVPLSRPPGPEEEA